MQTTIENKTEKDFNLKERTAGVSRPLKLIKRGDNHVVKVNPDATYKEYWCVTNNDDLNAVILSSDDCLDYQKIEIKLKDNTQPPTYIWEGVDRRTTQATDEAGAKAWYSPVKEKWNAFFKKGERSA